MFHLLNRPDNGVTFLVSLLTYLVGIFPSMVYALPTDGSVQAGSTTVDPVSATQLNIYQTSDEAVIDWHSVLQSNLRFKENLTESISYIFNSIGPGFVDGEQMVWGNGFL